MKNARFKRQVRPGDVMEMESRIVRTRGNFAFVEGRASVDGQLAATVELTLAFRF